MHSDNEDSRQWVVHHGIPQRTRHGPEVCTPLRPFDCRGRVSWLYMRDYMRVFCCSPLLLAVMAVGVRVVSSSLALAWHALLRPS